MDPVPKTGETGNETSPNQRKPDPFSQASKCHGWSKAVTPWQSGFWWKITLDRLFTEAMSNWCSKAKTTEIKKVQKQVIGMHCALKAWSQTCHLREPVMNHVYLKKRKTQMAKESVHQTNSNHAGLQAAVLSKTSHMSASEPPRSSDDRLLLAWRKRALSSWKLVSILLEFSWMELASAVWKSFWRSPMASRTSFIFFWSLDSTFLNMRFVSCWNFSWPSVSFLISVCNVWIFASWSPSRVSIGPAVGLWTSGAQRKVTV